MTDFTMFFSGWGCADLWTGFSSYCATFWFTAIKPDLRVRVIYPVGQVEFRERFFCLRIPRWSARRWKAKT